MKKHKIKCKGNGGNWKERKRNIKGIIKKKGKYRKLKEQTGYEENCKENKGK